MAALTEDRITASRTGDLLSLPIAATVTCYAGGMAVVKADGTVRPAIVDGSAPVCKGVGRFRIRATAVDNTNADIETGVFRWDNHTTDPVTDASISAVCYATDDHTVAATSGNLTRTPAGIVVSIDSLGVWVRMGSWSSLPASKATLSNVALGTVAASGTGVVRFVALSSGYISSFGTVLSGALSTGDATLTAAIEGTGVTGGVQTIPMSGSAAGVTQITTPTALNSFVAGDVISFTVGGSASGGSVIGITVGIVTE